jgi:bifunctional non-homologous end joining protein LigD
MEDITPDEYVVETTHTDRIYFPDDGITKGDLIDYYEAISETMLPHVQGRPVTTHRFPNGIGDNGFIQKEAPDYFPSWFERVEVPTREDEGTVRMAVIRQAADLVFLANLGGITQHIWLSRIDRPDNPDKLIFDIDPDEAEFVVARSTAAALRSILEDELGLVAFVMTTGSKGLHVVVPLDRAEGFDDVRQFAQDVAAVLVHRDPDTLTTEQRKENRGGRVYIDTLRNAYGRTSVAPYSVRALPGAPVATPLDWKEIEDPNLTAQTCTIRNTCDHLDRVSDPWERMWDQACSLDEAREALSALCSEVAEERVARGG